MKRSGPPQRRTRIKPRSARTIAQARQRREALEAVYLRDGDGCDALRLVPEIPCSGPIDGDERLSRAQSPGSHLNPDLIHFLCRRCHDFRTKEAIHSTVLLMRDPRRGMIRYFPTAPPSLDDVRVAVEALALWKLAGLPYHVGVVRVDSRARANELMPEIAAAWAAIWQDTN